MIESSVVRVLLVEDNRQVSRKIRQLIAQIGEPFRLDFAGRLSSGLEHLAHGGADTVLLDLSLPDDKGLGGLAELRARYPEVPIVALTNSGCEPLALQAVEKGADECSSKKGMDIHALSRAIHHAINRKKRESAIHRSEVNWRSLEIERVISTISSRFVGTSDIDAAISESLRNLGKLSGASRVYVFLIRKDEVTMDNSHEWCAEGVSPQIENLQKIPTSMVPWWMKKLHGGELIHITDVSQMPSEAASEKEILEKQDIKSLLVLPIYANGRLCGFTGFDNVIKTGDWSREQMALLRVASQVFGNAIERRQAAIKLRHYMAELERSNRELEEFAYVASHDLQEPLCAITGFAQLLKKRYLGKLDPDADEFITFMINGTRRMKAMIDSLLAYSRVGTQGRRFEPVELEALLDRALANLKAGIEASDAEITHDPLPRVTADSLQIVQLFQNLLGNAIKYRGEEPPRIHVGASREHGEWAFCVRDNGIGIDTQFAARIFGIFQRLHGKDEYAGTGIGLALCKKIVERHGGRIWVESAPGAGSTFCFTIPGKG